MPIRALACPAAHDPLASRLEAIVRDDADLMRLLSALQAFGLPQWRVVSGAIYQTVWNALTGLPRGTGLKDYDVAYFDPDTSYDAEDRVIRRFDALQLNLPCPVEIRNQARVHLWFERRFGVPYAPLRSVEDGLTRYASRCHAVAVRLEPDGRFDIAAPFGLEDVFQMRIRPNRILGNQATHEAKAARAKAIWPNVSVEPW